MSQEREDIHSPGRQERRQSIRLSGPFPVLVRGVETGGQQFTSETVLDNISAGGLYLRTTQRLAPGMKLFAVVHLVTSPPSGTPAPRVAVRGVVLRAEMLPDGRYGVGMQFTRHRFL